MAMKFRYMNNVSGRASLNSGSLRKLHADLAEALAAAAVADDHQQQSRNWRGTSGEQGVWPWASVSSSCLRTIRGKMLGRTM